MITTNTITIVFGTAALAGGKIHRTGEGDHAWCLSGMGHKPLRGIVTRVQHDGKANLDAEVEALRAAKVSADAICTKCASAHANRMKEAGA